MRKKFLFLKRSIRKLFFEDTCSCCQKELKKEESILCQECFQIWKKKSLLRYYEGHYYVHLYQEPIRSWIHEYKFQGRKEFGEIFAKWMKKAFWECYDRNKIDIVVPVPIHEKRRLERGFNQTEEILKHLSVPYITIERYKNTKHLYQYGMKRDRQEIMEAAFYCPISLEGKNVLLFDDIITTGTTISEMKKAICQKGMPNKIVSFAFALSERVKIEHKSGGN